MGRFAVDQLIKAFDGVPDAELPEWVQPVYTEFAEREHQEALAAEGRLSKEKEK